METHLGTENRGEDLVEDNYSVISSSLQTQCHFK